MSNKTFSIRSIIISLSFATLVGCGGGDNGDSTSSSLTDSTSSTPTDSTSSTPIDTRQEFSLAAYKDLTEGTIFSSGLTGNDSDGNAFSGSITVTNRPQELLGDVLVTPRDIIISYTVDGTPVTQTRTDYYDDAVFLLQSKVRTGVTCLSSSPYTVPDTVSTGDAGIFSSTSCDDNTIRESNWRVEDAKDGKIYFILGYTTKDEFGSIISTGEDKYTVDSNNEIVGVEVTTTEIRTGYTLTLTGAVENGDAYSSPIGSTITISDQQTQPSQPTPTNTQAKLLFKSSFETSDVCSRSDSLPCNTPYHCGVDAVLKGGDPGYDWLSDFPTGGSDNFFNDVIGEYPDCCPNGCLSQSLSECHELDVVTTLDKNGQQTKALYWKLKKDCSQNSKSRMQFNMREPGEYNPVYFRYWVKFEDGWPQNTQGKWRQLWEFYYEDNDWSNALVFNWGSEGPFWVLNGRYYGPDCCEPQWTKTSNKQIPKGGEWFLVETYLYSHYTDGQIIVKINGEEIFNHQGRTNRRPGQKPVTAAMFKTYGDGWGKFEQWIDDFEMWTADPGYVDR